MESGSLEFAFLPFSFCKKTPACNPLSRLYFLPLASSGFRNRIETSNFKSLGLVQVKSGSQLQIQDRHYGPSKKKKIPPELTNRYVKNEAFIVVVFDNILTLLLTIRITILSDCCCCCFQTHSHPTGSALNVHPLANCQCGNASSNSISIFKRYSNIWTFKYLSTSKLEYPTIQIFEYQHI